MLCVDINDTVIQCSLGNSCNLECYCSKLQLLKRILHETSHFNCDTDKNNIVSLHLMLDINHTTHISHISHIKKYIKDRQEKLKLLILRRIDPRSDITSCPRISITPSP